MIGMHILFESKLSDDTEFDKDGDPVAPAGRRHAEWLFSQMNSTLMTKTVRPWNEEDYAWEFIGRIDRVHISVLVSSYFNGNESDASFLVTVQAFSFAWIFPRRSQRAVSQAVDTIEQVLRSDPRIENIEVFDKSELRRRQEVLRKHFQAMKR